jgi:hypothetical protein
MAIPRADLTYDRGIMLAYGLETGTDLVFEIVNGSGIDEGIGSRFDNDKYKNFFGRVSQNIGEHFRIGAMGYWGKEADDLDVENKLTMYGADATINFSLFELNLQYIQRKDDNPYFFRNRSINLGGVFDIETTGGFAELIFRPKGDDSKWYAAGLFNWVDVEDFESPQDYQSISGHLGYLLNRNIRLTGELTYNIKDDYSRIGIGFVTAF